MFTQPQSPALWWGAALVFLGVALQVYAKGCLRQNQTVSMGGPYRFVRHPFYTANFLLDLGLAVMSGWWPLMVALPLWWLLVYVPTMRREEAILTGLFPDTYPDYQRRLPRLMPFRRPLAGGGRRLLLAQQQHHRAHRPPPSAPALLLSADLLDLG